MPVPKKGAPVPPLSSHPGSLGLSQGSPVAMPTHLSTPCPSAPHSPGSLSKESGPPPAGPEPQNLLPAPHPPAHPPAHFLPAIPFGVQAQHPQKQSLINGRGHTHPTPIIWLSPRKSCSLLLLGPQQAPKAPTANAPNSPPFLT